MAFLAAHPDFALLDANEILARQGVSGLSGQSEGMLQLLPSVHSTDGFFAAVMEHR